MSDSDNEADMVSYGTPLEPLEEDEIPQKRPCMIEDQIVTDKQGRRRFHGAFTGGFSAGFYNTVGTLEGWKPSSFKSSKSEKQQMSKQKPEDFMDEEDFDEFGIAPLVLKAKIDYMTNPRMTQNFFCPPNVGKYVLKDLLKPARETLGIKLLKEMGWKPGQGVGPRVTKNEKKKSLEIQEKTYGCQLPSGFLNQPEESESDSDTDLKNIKFAPYDYEILFYKPKDNFFGIGYEGLDKRSILGSTDKAGNIFKETNKKIRTSSQAFGVGAFEEEDEDIYLKDDMSRYDYSLGNENYSELAEKASVNNDGALEGFILEIKKYHKNHYLLPLLPKNFKPRLEVTDIVNQPSHSIRNKPSRWNKNDEDQTSFMKKNIEELQNEVNNQDKALTEELISKISVSTNQFKPFANIPEKQERYEKYLKLVKINKTDCLKSLQPFGMTDWDREREKIEFKKAAELFRPLSAEMEDRFLTASQPDDLSDPLAVVEKFRNENDDRKKAAEINMFGTLTRKIEDWTPCPLLCKRFNIPDPKKSDAWISEEKPNSRKKYSLFNCLNDIPPRKETTQEKISEEKEPKKTPQEKVSEEKELKILEKKSSENFLSKEKLLDPPQEKFDLFQAIFLASDDENEDNMGKNFSEEKQETKQETELLYEERVLNFKRNADLPSGIFENIDLDSLNKKTKLSNEGSDKFIETASISTTNDLRESGELNLVYGPKIPEGVGVRPIPVRIENTMDDDNWVEKKSHHKKKKKEKKHKHKSKQKHKKSKK